PGAAQATLAEPSLGQSFLDDGDREGVGLGAELCRGLGDVVEHRADLSIDAVEAVRQANAEVAALVGAQGCQQRTTIEGLGDERRLGSTRSRARGAALSRLGPVGALAGHRILDRRSRTWPRVAPRIRPVC